MGKQTGTELYGSTVKMRTVNIIKVRRKEIVKEREQNKGRLETNG